MNGTAPSGGGGESITGYAKYRPAGTAARVLADDSTVFSLDDEGVPTTSSSLHGGPSSSGLGETEKSRLVECPLDSEGEEEEEEGERGRRKRANGLGPQQNRGVPILAGAPGSQIPSQQQKPIGKVDNSLTRLTSSSIYDLDADEGDSMASDELDLLPPLSSVTSGTSTRMSMSSLLQCCKPRRVPIKCAIL